MIIIVLWSFVMRQCQLFVCNISAKVEAPGVPAEYGPTQFLREVTEPNFCQKFPPVSGIPVRTPLNPSLHPGGTSNQSDICEGFKSFWLDFTKVVCEKIYFEAHRNEENICRKNNGASICCLIGSSHLHWNFSTLLWDVTDIHGFSEVAHA